jgi:hypothetical protein
MRVLYLGFFYYLWCTVNRPDNQYISATDYSSCSWKTQNTYTYCAPPPLPTAVWVGLLTVEASRSHSDTPVCRAPLDEWSARRRDLYLTTHNTHERQTSMLPAGFEPKIPASQRPQTHALGRAAMLDLW